MDKQLIKKIIIILLISLFLEIFLFNFTSFETLFGKYEKKFVKNHNF